MKRLLMSLAALVPMLSGPAVAQEAGSSYAVQNVASGKDLRPQGANAADGTGIVTYDHWAWKCMTWRFVPAGGNTFRLENRYTAKTLQPSGRPAPQTSLWQRPLTDDAAQRWEFVPGPDGTYRIKLAGTALYLTASSERTNSPVILMPAQGSSAQQWKLIAQDPWL